MGKPCESDFYLLEGKAARERYAEMQENPLWFINGKAMRMSDEEIKKREEDEDKIIRLRCDARARRDIKARLEAFDYITLAKPCTLETDPLKAGWRA
jgi:guanylate kinase